MIIVYFNYFNTLIVTHRIWKRKATADESLSAEEQKRYVLLDGKVKALMPYSNNVVSLEMLGGDGDGKLWNFASLFPEALGFLVV